MHSLETGRSGQMPSSNALNKSIFNFKLVYIGLNRIPHHFQLFTQPLKEEHLYLTRIPHHSLITQPLKEEEGGGGEGGRHQVSLDSKILTKINN